MADTYVQHIIRKQFIDVTVGRQDKIFNLQNELSEYYYSDILPLLEKIFDRISVETDVISIDCLEIDLGRFSEKEFAWQIKEGEILQKIEKLLYQQLKIWDHREASPALFRKTAIAGAFEQWIYYMKKGLLPWNLLQIDALWRNRVLENLATDYHAVSLLRHSLQTNGVLLKRIVSQNDQIFLVSLVEVLTALSQQSLPQAMQELEQVIEYIHKKIKPVPVLLNSKTPDIIWQRILVEATARGNEGTALELVEAALLHVLPKEEWKGLTIPRSIKLTILGPVIKKIIKNISGEKTGPGRKNKGKKSRQAKDDLTMGNDGDQTKTSSADVNVVARNSKNDQTTKEGKKGLEEIVGKEDLNQEDERIAEQQQIDEEGIFVPFAGVVLAHSFIHSFFKQVNIVNESKFISVNAQQRGIHLLHYLATGRTEAEEYELAVPKILCSYPLEETIDKEIDLSEQELTEVNDLLAVLIEHWGVNISIEGLRGNFLTRGGKLSSKNEQLQLIMEKNGVDILLRTFPVPWNMSVIKLPWLRQPIYIEW